MRKFRFRNPFLYKILYTYVSILHKLYYRKITVVGLEKLPANTPIIFAPNHQNALMDALAVLFTTRKSVAFMARADIFKNPRIAKILNLLKILPIYRIRDGYGELGKNQESFENTVEVFKANIPLCILPEGNHEGQKRLRQLKKGIFRVAFQAENNSTTPLNLTIVPVGLDYSNYFDAGSDLTVVFGTPIKIADYTDEYKKNEAKTINTLMTLLAENMQCVMIHIPEEHYQLIYQLSEIYEPNVWNTCNVKRHPYNKLTIKQYIIQKLSESFDKNPENAEILNEKLTAYLSKTKEFCFDDCVLQQNPQSIFSLIFEVILSFIVLPIHLFGLITSYLPYKLTTVLSKKIKDKHFKSSVQFGIGLFLFPIYYLIITAIFCIFTDDYLVKIAFGLSLPVTALFAFYYYKHLKKLSTKLRLFFFRNTKPLQYRSLIEQRTQLINLTKATINN